MTGKKPSTKKKHQANSQKRISITYTALIWTGIILALFGAIVAVLGVGGTQVFEGKFGNIEIKTVSVGLAILIVGAILAGITALRLPPDVHVLGKSQQTVTERVAERPLLFWGVGALGCVLLIFSLFYTK